MSSVFIVTMVPKPEVSQYSHFKLPTKKIKDHWVFFFSKMCEKVIKIYRQARVGFYSCVSLCTLCSNLLFKKTVTFLMLKYAACPRSERTIVALFVVKCESCKHVIETSFFFLDSNIPPFSSASRWYPDFQYLAMQI